MYPELTFVAGPFRVEIAMHAATVALGVAAGVGLAARRGGHDPRVAIAAGLVAAAALAGSRALFVVLHDGSGRGLASTGGVLAALVATAAVARAVRIPFRVLLDAIAPAGLLALAIGRVGCFLAGCCYGRPTALPWRVVFPELGPPARHPVELYSAIGDTVVLLFCLHGSRGAPGALARRAAIGLGVLRFGLELLRDPAAADPLPGGWVTLAQAAALALVVWGFFGLRAPATFDYASAAEERAWATRRAGRT